uniref:Uncharacterized protein n=1 Tax=Solanum lycopersicum TaxID=4081 RepID=A0A3Q7ISR1_SOLLC
MSLMIPTDPSYLYKIDASRLKLWLFIAYVVSFVSLAASVGLLIQDALEKSGPSAWIGVAVSLAALIDLLIQDALYLAFTFKRLSSYPDVSCIDVQFQRNFKMQNHEISINEEKGVQNMI